MPISIYSNKNHENEPVAWLCDQDWELPSQIDGLEEWLLENEDNLPSGSYVADIGFDIRKDASGGGAALSVQAMAIMVKLGMDLFLSEYPSSGEHEIS
ncbi:MAG: hypothetical protein HC916_01675 [Coleofasciculaceae cyanobacterium SM2_1_6]|nr:hypothetical protein [Coleofasciculaceae cyanobacterium SM2_1_6]